MILLVLQWATRRVGWAGGTYFLCSETGTAGIHSVLRTSCTAAQAFRPDLKSHISTNNVEIKSAIASCNLQGQLLKMVSHANTVNREVVRTPLRCRLSIPVVPRCPSNIKRTVIVIHKIWAELDQEPTIIGGYSCCPGCWQGLRSCQLQTDCHCDELSKDIFPHMV